MASDIGQVAPSEMIPPAASKLWPEMVPVHGITLVVGIRPDGNQALHVVYDTEAPPWVLIGLLETVKGDLLKYWQQMEYDDGDEEE